MKLSEYLNLHGVTPAEFGRRIGVKSRMTALRYANGERIPRPEIMARILAATDGLVTPDDFYGAAAARRPAGWSQELEGAAA